MQLGFPGRLGHSHLGRPFHLSFSHHHHDQCSWTPPHGWADLSEPAFISYFLCPYSPSSLGGHLRITVPVSSFPFLSEAFSTVAENAITSAHQGNGLFYTLLRKHFLVSDMSTQPQTEDEGVRVCQIRLSSRI